MTINQQMDFHCGYIAALEEVRDILTTGDGRTEAFEDALAFIQATLKAG